VYARWGGFLDPIAFDPARYGMPPSSLASIEPIQLLALETARAERVNPTADYLLGIPMLADYLEEGLEKLGYSVEDAEEDLL
jgi:hypothetical protein